VGVTDKVTGRAKQAAGDVAGDEDTRRQGEQEEKKGDVKNEAAQARGREVARRQPAREPDLGRRRPGMRVA
jgi:uncharacterized protein YjbJ (UPF0337 family)